MNNERRKIKSEKQGQKCRHKSCVARSNFTNKHRFQEDTMLGMMLNGRGMVGERSEMVGNGGERWGNGRGWREWSGIVRRGGLFFSGSEACLQDCKTACDGEVNGNDVSERQK